MGRLSVNLRSLPKPPQQVDRIKLQMLPKASSRRDTPIVAPHFCAGDNFLPCPVPEGRLTRGGGPTAHDGAIFSERRLLDFELRGLSAVPPGRASSLAPNQALRTWLLSRCPSRHEPFAYAAKSDGLSGTKSQAVKLTLMLADRRVGQSGSSRTPDLSVTAGL
jgi:hypothetical protein